MITQYTPSTHSKLTEQVARVGADCLDMRHSSALEALELVLLWIIANFSAMHIEHPQQIVRRLADFALLGGEAVSERHNTTDAWLIDEPFSYEHSGPTTPAPQTPHRLRSKQGGAYSLQPQKTPHRIRSEGLLGPTPHSPQRLCGRWVV